MAMEGTLKSRNGKLYVLYTYDEYGEPFRQFLWWPVLETRGSGYGERPEAGDIAASTGHGGEWKTRNPSTHRSTGSVSTGTGSTQAELVERASIPAPAAGGKELRWHDGRWEKLTAKGWTPAGEGKAKGSKKSPTRHATVRHHATKKKPSQIQREIDEALAKGPPGAPPSPVAVGDFVSFRSKHDGSLVKGRVVEVAWLGGDHWSAMVKMAGRPGNAVVRADELTKLSK